MPGQTRKKPFTLLLLGVVIWTAGITFAHIAANIGLGTFREDVRILLGLERRSLRVGFLPVT